MSKEEFEQTLVLIKPDALKNSLTGYVLSQLSEFHTGLRFAGAKIVEVSRMLAEEHYAEHRGKIFFPSILDYIMGLFHYPNDPWKRRVIAFVYQGPGSDCKDTGYCRSDKPAYCKRAKAGMYSCIGHCSGAQR